MIGILIAAVAVAAHTPPSRPGMMIVDSVPPQSARLTGTYSCYTGRRISIALEQSAGAVRLTELRRDKVSATRSQFSMIQNWLKPLALLSSIDVECAEEGAVVTVVGRRSLDPRDGLVITFTWSGSHLFNMAP